MSTRVVDRVEEWDSRSFTGGYRELEELADREFSGLVRAGGTELYMTRGVGVGLRNGEIEAFDGASGTVYEAPSPALPLLAVMQERSDEVRDSFYTEQTPISEVDRTLSQGGFTGYVELSENVLSGDYYLVYHAGKSMSVGFVGQSGRLLDGDEAFDTADDEVGIYQVRPVDIDPIDLPAPKDTGGAATTPQGTQEPETEPAASPARPSDEAATAEESGDGDATEETGDSHGTGTDETADETAEETEPDGTATESAPEEATDGQTEDEPTPETESPGEPAEAESPKEPAEAESPGEPAETESRSETADTEPEAGAAGAESGSTGSGVGSGHLEVRAIPSLEPARTERTRTASDTGDSVEPGPERPPAAANVDQVDRTAADDRDGATATGGDRAPDRTGKHAAPERVETLKQRIIELGRERDQLQEQLATVRVERDELATALEAQSDASETVARQELTPQAARSATVVFVRYRSQGDVTLDTVHGGGGDRERLRENLQLEIYNGFDEPIAVDGEPYETFVENTIEYRFVEWAIADLLFEIRETGNQKALRGLYDALPKVDRADLNGSVPVDTEGGETESERFDVVLRDRRERPLLVANINDSRNPVTGTQMERLVTAAGNVAGSLQAAVLVTRSYFDGEALELADEATKGKLLSRDKRKSFVSRSRNQGYHLCLIEAREGSPHLVMPEL